MTIYPTGQTEALKYCTKLLKQKGVVITDDPKAATHLLLPVPSFDPDGQIKGGGDLQALLALCDDQVTVIGGNLNHPALQGKKTIDLLQDPVYLAQNANITAHCALALAMNRSKAILQDMPVLVIGWGRIGKCLGKLLQAIGASVTVAARKPTDQAALLSLGYQALAPEQIRSDSYAVIFNTAPEMVLPQGGSGILIDLASKPGIAGEGVIWARGLPNLNAPESSGALIACTVLRKGEGS